MEQSCCVCGEPLDSDNVSRCNLCGGDFHMAWSTKASVKECGHYRFIVCAVSVQLVKALEHARLGSFANLLRTEPRAKMVQPEALQAAGGMMACMTNKKRGHLCPPP